MRSAKGCPICGGPNKGEWTCIPCGKLVTVHRELIRNLQHWRVLHEGRQAPDVLVAGDGKEYCLWDVEKFYDARRVLPERQQLTIEMNLYQDRPERDCARQMGIGLNNPVAIYGTVGLTRLLAFAVKGDIEGYFIPIPEDCSAVTGVYLDKESSAPTPAPAPEPEPLPAPAPKSLMEETMAILDEAFEPRTQMTIVVERVTTSVRFVTFDPRTLTSRRRAS